MSMGRHPPRDGTPLRFQFGADDAGNGWIAIGADRMFDPGTGYGWVTGNPRPMERPNAEPYAQHLVLSRAPAEFAVAVKPGRYRCTFLAGDPKGAPRAIDIAIRGQETQVPTARTEGQTFLSVTIPVIAIDGRLAIRFSSPDAIWAVCQLVIAPAEPSEHVEAGITRFLDNRWNLPPETGNGPAAMLARWFEETGELPPPDETSLTGQDYLQVITGCVDFFLQHQDETGAIIDPYKKVEFQYATPCFAYVAALLAAHAGRAGLIAPAIAAFAHAAKALASRTAADGHEDFYPAPLAHAYRLLATVADPRALEAAAAPLKTFDPYRTYRKRPGGTKRSGANWNCKALAGHQMLIRLGLAEDTGYVTDSLLKQGWLFNNEFGLYAEGPMTYDAFPRAWLADMLAWGYDGAGRQELEEALVRGAITSLFMQSPTGDLPPGGRSSHHLWSDALQCVIFEWAAGGALSRNDQRLAGVFTRAARRALCAVLPWIRPSGELSIVKNRCDPAERHGFEVYSSHSQYNLLAMTALGFAFELSTDRAEVAEHWTPAEQGCFSLRIGSGIEKFFAACSGTQVEVATMATPLQTPRGILRINMRNLPMQLPMSDGAPADPMFHLDNPLPGGVAMGLAWHDPDGNGQDLLGRPVQSLAGLSGIKVIADVLEGDRGPDRLDAQIRYRIARGGLRTIEERIVVASGSVEVTWHPVGDADRVLLRWPLFAGDGQKEAQIDAGEDTITVGYDGGSVTFKPSGTGPVRISQTVYPFRNGFFRLAEADCAGEWPTLRITAAVGGMESETPLC